MTESFTFMAVWKAKRVWHMIWKISFFWSANKHIHERELLCNFSCLTWTRMLKAKTGFLNSPCTRQLRAAVSPQLHHSFSHAKERWEYHCCCTSGHNLFNHSACTVVSYTTSLLLTDVIMKLHAHLLKWKTSSSIFRRCCRVSSTSCFDGLIPNNCEKFMLGDSYWKSNKDSKIEFSLYHFWETLQTQHSTELLGVEIGIILYSLWGRKLTSRCSLHGKKSCIIVHKYGIAACSSTLICGPLRIGHNKTFWLLDHYPKICVLQVEASCLKESSGW